MYPLLHRKAVIKPDGPPIRMQLLGFHTYSMIRSSRFFMQGRRLTDFCGKLPDTLIRPDDLLTEQKFFNRDLRLNAFRQGVQGVDDPVLAVQRYDGVVRKSK